MNFITRTALPPITLQVFIFRVTSGKLRQSRISKKVGIRQFATNAFQKINLQEFHLSGK